MGANDWRAIYAQVFEDAAYQRLSSAARLVLLTARLGTQTSFAGIARYSVDALTRQTGLEPHAVEGALKELEGAKLPWVSRDADVLWVTVHPLLRDPTSGLNTPDKRRGAINLVSLLPRASSIVRKFKRVNHLGSTPPRSRGSRAPAERDRDRERDRERKREREAAFSSSLLSTNGSYEQLVARVMESRQCTKERAEEWIERQHGGRH